MEVVVRRRRGKQKLRVAARRNSNVERKILPFVRFELQFDIRRGYKIICGKIGQPCRRVKHFHSRRFAYGHTAFVRLRAGNGKRRNVHVARSVFRLDFKIDIRIIDVFGRSENTDVISVRVRIFRVTRARHGTHRLPVGRAHVKQPYFCGGFGFCHGGRTYPLRNRNGNRRDNQKYRASQRRYYVGFNP